MKSLRPLSQMAGAERAERSLGGRNGPQIRWGKQRQKASAAMICDRMESDFCELGISRRTAFCSSGRWTSASSGADPATTGRAELRREITEVYAGHKAKQWRESSRSPFRLSERGY